MASIKRMNANLEHSKKMKEILSKRGSWRKGTTLSEETKLKISKAKKGVSIKSKGKKKPNGSIALTGRKLSDEHKKNISKALSGRKLSAEHIKRALAKNPKSSLEIKFEDLICNLGLPYNFVGNGKTIIAGKCPDFINSKGEKIAIEVFFRRHKEKFRGGLERWKAERIKLFSEEGWELLFFDETQVNKEEISSKLGS